MKTTEFYCDNIDNKIVVVESQDVEPILKANKESRRLGDGYTPSRDLQRVASIPLVVVQIFMKEGLNIYNPDDLPAIMKKLDDPEWKHLKTGGVTMNKVTVPSNLTGFSVVDKRGA